LPSSKNKLTMQAIHITLITFSVITLLPSCMIQTVTDSGGEVLYSKPIHGTPWESEERQLEEVKATERSLGMPNGTPSL